LVWEFAAGLIEKLVQVVGVVTDNPSDAASNSHVRFWRYGYTRAEANLVRNTASMFDIPTYSGRIDTRIFRDVFEEQWRPQLIVVSAFGQRLHHCFYSYPAYGAFNLHPGSEDFPSYAGPTPYEEMIADGRAHHVINMHSVTDHIDHGPFVARSERIPIPLGATVKDMHLLAAAPAARFAATQVAKMIAEATNWPEPIQGARRKEVEVTSQRSPPH
jgi:methionyl-tRNA formyltransferase